MERKTYDMDVMSEALAAVADGVCASARLGVAAKAKRGEQIDDYDIARVEQEIAMLEGVADGRRKRLAELRKSAEIRGA